MVHASRPVAAGGVIVVSAVNHPFLAISTVEQSQARACMFAAVFQPSEVLNRPHPCVAIGM